MDFNKFNSGSKYEKIDWGVDTKDFPFVSIRDLWEKNVKKTTVFGLFFSKGNFGLQPNAIGAGYILNLPQHLNDDISKMLDDKEAVEAIKKGDLTLCFYQYDSKYRKGCFGVSFENTVRGQPTQPAQPAQPAQPPIF